MRGKHVERSGFRDWNTERAFTIELAEWLGLNINNYARTLVAERERIFERARACPVRKV